MRTLLLTAALAASLVTPRLGGAQQPPSIDYNSLLTSVKALDNGSLVLSGIITVFLPADAMRTGKAGEKQRLFLTLNKDGQELTRVPHILQPIDTVFARATSYGHPPVVQVPGPGDYVIEMEFDGRNIATLPFKANFVGGDDPFAPDKKMIVDGPWSRLVSLMIAGPGDPDEHLEVTLWPQASTKERENVDLQVFHSGQMIYESRDHVASTRNPNRAKIKLQFPKAGGGDWVRLKDIVKQDGVYELIVRHDEKETARYSYQVVGGKIEPHVRSALTYEPHTGYLVSRHPELGQDVAAMQDLYWAELGTAPAPGAAAPAATGPTPADLERWQVKGSHDPKRPFALTHTPVVVRMDAAIAAGDGVIAFGTGGFKGVAYMNAGDTDSRTIPEGQTFRAAYIEVAGKKVILVDGKHVAVFDTATGKLTKIPPDEIYLALPLKSMREPNPLDVSGYLVATINDASKVDDRAVVKLIDVSGPDPKVFALGNADFQGREATSIAVDAGTGLVAVSSQRKNAIYTAKAAPGAAMDKHDLSAHDGVESAPLVADSGLVAYRDDAGKAKFRLLDPSSGKIYAIGTLGPPAFGYAMNGGTYAYATVDGHGSDYAYAKGKAPNAVSTVPGTGNKMTGGTGKLGYGQTAAIAPDGTLFVAGAGKSGLGSSEFLMALSGGGWKELTGAEGKALPACDVAMGNGLMAFKSGKRNDTTVSYATFGSTITP